MTTSSFKELIYDVVRPELKPGETVRIIVDVFGMVDFSMDGEGVITDKTSNLDEGQELRVVSVELHVDIRNQILKQLGGTVH